MHDERVGKLQHVVWPAVRYEWLSQQQTLCRMQHCFHGCSLQDLKGVVRVIGIICGIGLATSGSMGSDRYMLR